MASPCPHRPSRCPRRALQSISGGLKGRNEGRAQQLTSAPQLGANFSDQIRILDGETGTTWRSYQMISIAVGLLLDNVMGYDVE